MRFAVSKRWLVASLNESRKRANRIVSELENYPLVGEGDKLLMLARDTLRRLDGLK